VKRFEDGDAFLRTRREAVKRECTPTLIRGGQNEIGARAGCGLPETGKPVTLGGMKFRWWKATPYLCCAAFLFTGQSSFAYWTDEAWPIMLKEVKIKDANLDEAVEYLRGRAKLDDCIERDPQKKGINLIITDPLKKIERNRRVSLELHDVRASDVVKLLAKMLDVTLKIEPYAIVFSPKDDNKEMYTRTYKVPPDFRRLAGAFK
jgi:hypothetical protein